MLPSLAERSVAVVVPNYNGATFVGATLRSLLAQTHPATEIIVIDNGSTDGSRALFETYFPHVRVIAMPRNCGFAGAANAGLRATDADLVAVLNSDARPRPDWLHVLLEQPDDPGVWAWGSVLAAPDGSIESAGDHYHPGGFAYKLARGSMLGDLPDGPYDVFAPPGASPLMRRELVLDLGGYADRFFLYYEDIDLSFRALLAGYRAVVVPKAVVEHDLGRSSAGNTRPWFYIGRNSLWCALRCQPQVHPRLLWRRTRAELRTARERGGSRAYIAGRAAGVLGIPWALHTRRRIQSRRVVDPGAVSDVLRHPPRLSVGGSS